MKKEKDVLPPVLRGCIPSRILMSINALIAGGTISAEDISEIRLRAGRPTSVTCAGANIILNESVSAEMLAECVAVLCRGSVYVHSDTIRCGYIHAGEGIRVGICGTLAADGRAVREISSLNIRIPHIIRGVCMPVLRLCFDGARLRSLLIYSPPGEGKTTLLRDLACMLGGKYKRRIAIIDTRAEIFITEMFSDTLCDILTGYPRADGIGIATRTLSPELIICDEIGDLDEVRQMLAAVNAGVPIIASAHASDINELMLRTNIRTLHDSGVFEGYVGIMRERVNGKPSGSFVVRYTPCREVNAEEQTC